MSSNPKDWNDAVIQGQSPRAAADEAWAKQLDPAEQIEAALRARGPSALRDAEIVKMSANLSFAEIDDITTLAENIGATPDETKEWRGAVKQFKANGHESPETDPLFDRIEDEPRSDFDPAFEQARAEAEPWPPEQPEPEPLPVADIADDADIEVAPREWLIRDRIPMEEPILFTGDGAVGKTTIGAQLCAATVWGGDWFGKMVEKPGNALFVSAEEDDREIKRKFDAVARSRGKTRHDLKGVKFISFANEPNCALAVANPRTEAVIPTATYHRLVRTAVEHDCRLIYLEAAGDFFVGNHMSTPQVRAFVALLRVMAKAARAAVVLVQHPSRSGMKEETGTFGSVAWRNSCRAQMYLYGIKGERDEPESDRRVLEWKKNNYAPSGERVIVRWQSGVFAPEGTASSLTKLAADTEIENLFLTLLDIATAQGRTVSHNTGKNYAPAVFEAMPGANGYKSRAFAPAMERLFSAGRVVAKTIGPPSKQRTIIVRAEPIHG